MYQFEFHEDPFEDYQAPPAPPKGPGLCEHCGKPGAKNIPSMTAYAKRDPTVWDWVVAEDGGLTPTEDVLPDPNPEPLLCPDCAEDYAVYWAEMWEEANRGRL